MKTQKSGLRRTVSASICVLLAVMVGLVSSGGVLAMTSLPHIEEIVSSVSNSGSFNILEIVPATGSGSIGYYVNGQEPVRDLSYLLSGLTSQSDRSDAVSGNKGILTELKNLQLLGSSGTETPLTAAGAMYTEKKPWELASGDSSAMMKLSLKTPEQATVAGTFQSAGGGDYDKRMNLAVGNPAADQVQKIDSFQYDHTDPQTPPGTCYYYSPTFTPLKKNSSLPDDTAVYEAIGASDASGNYSYYSYVGSSNQDLTLDSSITYYTVSATGQPYAGWDATHPYAAASGDYSQTAAGQGYFTIAGYKYAGAGAGHYAFTPGGSVSASIQYDTVWYSLGYQNNSWFLKYVFDQTKPDGTLTDAGSAMTVKVKSATPDEVTAADVQNAQLIVLSAGLNLSDGANYATAYKQNANDIDGKGGGGVYDAIVAADTAKTPILVDGALVSNADIGGTNIASLANALKGAGGSNNFVSGNHYFSAGFNGSGQLATKYFDQPFQNTAGFSDILTEIENENFLRQKDDPDTTDLLPDEVTMANAIRYIVNYGGQRQIGTKKKITVLDLEPGRGQALTSDTVRGWLGGDGSGISSSDISIVAMPTSEFIGKIDDLVENYDMIYVGSNLTGFHTTGSNYSGTTVYNDQKMNGLIYTNIGDTYRSSYLLSGLLDRDYYAAKTWQDSSKKQYPYINDASGTNATLFRFSGNDLTQSKADELKDFAKSGYPVVIADNLTGSNQAYSFHVELISAQGSGISANTQVKLTASVGRDSGTLPGGQYRYEWLKDGQIIKDETISSTNSTDTVTTGTSAEGNYSCKVTIGGKTATSAALTLTHDTQYAVQQNNGGSNGTFYYGDGIFSASLSSNPMSGQANQQIALTTTAALTRDSYYYFPSGDKLDFSWYKQGKPNPVRTGQHSIGGRQTSGSDAYTITLGPDAVGTYTCNVSVDYYGNSTATSNSVSISSGIAYSFTGGGAGSTIQVDPAAGSGLVINTARVDKASLMYSALASITGYKNVMSVSGASTNSETLRKYANLSKPQIVWVPAPSDSNSSQGYPTEYFMAEDGTVAGLSAENGNYYLRYSFSIRNDTDATPETTTYDCRLFLDLNADGLYKPNEQITDIVIRDSDGHLISPAKSGDTYRYALKAGVTYTVTRQMPSGYAGIIPWKLEVVKNDNDYIHASEVNYTHITPSAKTTLHVLQILDNGDDGIDLSTNKVYQPLFKQLQDFSVKIDTVHANLLSSPAYWINRTGDDDAPVKYDDINKYLDSYDMLIVGFRDEYQELDTTSAQAVVNFIGTGKSVLFTHDTTSLSNMQKVYHSYNSAATAISANGSVTSSTKPPSSNPDYWGYYFNTLLRDAVKLDRYGVTNSTYGISQYATKNTTYQKSISGVVAAGPLSGSDAASVQAAGYTVAYQPDNTGPSTPATVGETQGFTNYSLVRWPAGGVTNQYKATDSNYSSGRETTAVSQVNKGQITSYPFNVNTADFGGSEGDGGNYMSVSNTHEQYYQLNMNSNNIVVWYCLSNGAGGNVNSDYYASLPNDVVNSYYIFSCGNVTYSGAGHDSHPDDITPSEAKLFINTMIASYRSSVQKPSVSFTNDASGDGTAQYFFVTSDYNATTSPDGTKTLAPSGDMLNSDSRIYFKVTNPTLQQEDKNLALTFYYTAINAKTGAESAAQSFKTQPAVYNADTGGAVDSYSGGLVYDIQLPDEIQTALKDSGNSAVNLYVNVSSAGSDTKDPANDAKIQVRQVGLFSLG